MIDLVELILGDRDRIVQAIETGAAWEIWMQVELQILLRNDGAAGVAREVPYNSTEILDFLYNFGTDYTALELKVESATNAGKALLIGVENDVEKLANYAHWPDPTHPGTRYAVGIAYSDIAGQACAEYAQNHPQEATCHAYPPIVVLRVKV